MASNNIKLPSEHCIHSLAMPDGYRITVPHGEVIYVENFFSEEINARCLRHFLEKDNGSFKNIRWKQDQITLYGKTLLLPRLTAWYGDAGKVYTYSGITSRPNRWTVALLSIKRRIEQLAEVSFNTVLMNYYRDGDDYISWHADNERELGTNPVIGSVSFGEPRDFVLRLNSDHSEKMSFPLGNGALLIMRGEIQHYWQHSLPKRKQANGPRLNLTFRRIEGD